MISSGGRGAVLHLRKRATSVGQNFCAQFFLVLAVVLAMAGSWSGAAHAQTYGVRPLQVEADVPPGRAITIPFILSVAEGVEAQTLELEVVDLFQTPEGGWSFLRPEDQTVESALVSAREYMTLEETEVQVSAGQEKEVLLNVVLPRTARGTQFAALLVRSRQFGSAESALRIQFQFLVPILLGIEGRPAVEDVQIDDLELRLVPGDAERQGNTIAIADVANRGETYSRLSGRLRTERQVPGGWRLVTTSEIPERGILPGIVLNLPIDLGRALPSGTYRMVGRLQVGGRRMKPFERVFEYEGDPNIEAAAYDTELRIEPDRIDLQMVPGASRSSVIRVENPSDQPIEVFVSIATPEALAGMAMGEVLGDNLSAAPWIRVTPGRFTLRPEGNRNIRLVARMPRDVPLSAEYYAELNFQGLYDGQQSAGESQAFIKVRQPEVEVVRDGVVERLSVASSNDGPSTFFVRGQFINTGNVQLFPEMRVRLMDRSGKEAFRTVLDGEMGRLLPLGIRDFGATIDFAKIEPGRYRLLGEVEIPDAGFATRELELNVSRRGGVTEVEVGVPDQ